MGANKHVCVLGAGIAGLSTAWELARRGHRVTVLDRALPGSGASGGNGAQLSYSYVQPLAGPSVWAQLPELLFSPESPLKLRPRLDPQQWSWGLRFLAACNGRRSRRTTQALLALAARSRAAFDAVREQEGIACDFSDTGKLVLYRGEAAFAAARAQMALQTQLGGAPQHALGPAEVLAVEPALAASRVPLAGALYTPSECAADCQKVCDALAARLVQGGAVLRSDAAVQAIAQRNGRAVAACLQSREEVQADAFVLCLGAASVSLARSVGIRLPLYPLKGYSLTLDVDASAPRVSVTDAARKVVFARIGARLRVAGMAELVGDDRRIHPSRVASLQASTAALFPHMQCGPDLHPWTGMRPSTPTGEPIVGSSHKGPGNLVLNTGHGALGFTLAFGTAREVARLLSSRA